MTFSISPSSQVDFSKKNWAFSGRISPWPLYFPIAVPVWVQSLGLGVRPLVFTGAGLAKPGRSARLRSRFGRHLPQRSQVRWSKPLLVDGYSRGYAGDYTNILGMIIIHELENPFSDGHVRSYRFSSSWAQLGAELLGSRVWWFFVPLNLAHPWNHGGFTIEPTLLQWTPQKSRGGWNWHHKKWELS